MRTTILSLTLLAAGGTGPGRVQPAAPPYRDHETPVALRKPTIARNVEEQRRQEAEVARGQVAFEGQLTEMRCHPLAGDRRRKCRSNSTN